MASLLRSLSIRRTHHAALRACPGLLPALHRLLLPGARGWTELKAAVGWGRSVWCCWDAVREPAGWAGVPACAVRLQSATPPVCVLA